MAQTQTLPDPIATAESEWRANLDALAAARDVENLRWFEHHHAMTAARLTVAAATEPAKHHAALVSARTAIYAADLITRLVDPPRILRRSVEVSEQLAERDA